MYIFILPPCQWFSTSILANINTCKHKHPRSLHPSVTLMQLGDVCCRPSSLRSRWLHSCTTWPVLRRSRRKRFSICLGNCTFFSLLLTSIFYLFFSLLPHGFRCSTCPRLPPTHEPDMPPPRSDSMPCIHLAAVPDDVNT